MTFDELLKCDHNTPVRCADGALGVLIRWHEKSRSAGVQVPGEETIRVIPASRLVNVGGGALKESTRARSGHAFTSGSELIDVTSLHRPDPSWHVVDDQGHEHRWRVNGQPAASYNASERYDVPTLVDVHDGYGYYEDGEQYAIHHLECRQCGQHIEPGYTADTNRQFIGGLRWYRIDGASVSKKEFDRRVTEAQG